MNRPLGTASWRRALLVLLVAACTAGLPGCATKPQAQYKVYFCNMETTSVSEIRINYGGALWAIPPLPAPAKGSDGKCLGGYAITTMEVLPEGMTLKWVLGGRRFETAAPIKSRLNGIYPTSGIQVVFQNSRVELFEYVYPTSNHLVRLRIYPPIAPRPAPGPRKPVQVAGTGIDEAVALSFLSLTPQPATRSGYPLPDPHSDSPPFYRNEPMNIFTKPLLILLALEFLALSPVQAQHARTPGASREGSFDTSSR